MSFLFSILDKFKVWLALAGGVVLALGVAFLKGRAAGRASYAERVRKQREKANRIAREVEDDVAKASDDDIRRRASRWVSDGER